LLEQLAVTRRQGHSLDPPDESWVALRRQGLLRISVLVEEGQLLARDALVLMVLASHQRMSTGDVRLSLRDLARQLRLTSVGPVSHSVRRLRAAGFVALAKGRYVISPEISSCGGPRERRNHERLFAAALKQQAPIRPATPGDVAARHALPCQLLSPVAAA
jgi:hypothetical protein